MTDINAVPNDEDRAVAKGIVVKQRDDWESDDDTLITAIATALAAERAKVWKEAIEITDRQLADCWDGNIDTLRLIKLFETAAAGKEGK